MFLEKIIINFLHYYKGYEVNEAIKLYKDNSVHFKKVFDILGMDFIAEVASKISRGDINDRDSSEI